MAGHRKERINDEVAKEIAKILGEVKDPRIKNAFVSVTGARVSSDLKYAKIYFSHLGGDLDEIMNGFKSGLGFIRHKLAENMNMRITPELTFVKDDSIARGAHISSLFNRIASSAENDPADDD